MKTRVYSICILIVAVIVVTILFFFPFQKGEMYGVDCGKDLEGYDVMFVYLRSCPHCHNDLVRIKTLNLTERVYWVDAGDARCSQVIGEYSDYVIYHKNSNLSDIPVGIYVPTKVCLHNNLTYIGEMQTSELKEFFNKCVMK